MALPLIAALSRAQRAAIPFIRSGVDRGMSANAIGRLLRDNDMGVARGALLDIVRAFRNEHSAGLGLAAMGRAAIIDAARLPPSLTSLLRNYSYTVSYTGFNADGQAISGAVTVSTSRADLTRADIEEIAALNISGNQANYEIELEAVALTGGVRSVDLI